MSQTAEQPILTIPQFEAALARLSAAAPVSPVSLTVEILDDAVACLRALDVDGSTASSVDVLRQRGLLIDKARIVNDLVRNHLPATILLQD